MFNAVGDFKTKLQCCRWKIGNLFIQLCFDTSDIDKTLDVNNVTVTLLIRKMETFTPKIFCVTLQEAKVKMSISGSQITVIEPFKGTERKKRYWSLSVPISLSKICSKNGDKDRCTKNT